MAGLDVQVLGAKEAAAALHAFGPAVDRAFQKRLKDVGRRVAEEARQRAGWSRKIPPGIQYGSSRDGVMVQYVASAPAIGRLSETRDVWTHPLFGNRRHMYPQRGRPFLGPAVDAAEEAIEREAEEAIDEAAREVSV
jgi:plasmid stabilization system protein ParE